MRRKQNLCNLRNLWAIVLLFFIYGMASAADPKPKVAVFPLNGNAPETTRQRVGFSLRAKLDREGTYEPIDGPRMVDLASQSTTPVDYDTPLKDIQSLAKDSEAVVLIWGDLNGELLRLHVFDTRQHEVTPRDLRKNIHEPTDVRFVVEEILQTLADVKKFGHPNEEAVAHDADAERLWETNPNLVKNPGFKDGDGWTVLYQSEKYSPPVADALPELDRVNVYRAPGADGKFNTVLAMNISKICAENNGMACISDSIPIEPKTRYRLSFKYKSDGPKLHIFVKGYTSSPDINGKPVDREIYRRQVPPTAATGGQWVTIVDELNPQHIVGTVTSLRIDLYAYLHPGTVLFDDVVLKAVGAQTRQATDEAIKKPLAPPKSRKD